MSASETFTVNLPDLMSGNALKMAASLGQLESAQIRAAQSALAMQRAQAALARAEDTGNIAGREAALAGIERLKLQERLRAAQESERASQAAAKAEAEAQKAQEREQARAQAKAAADAERAQKEAARAQAKDEREQERAAARVAAIAERESQKAARAEALNQAKAQRETEKAASLARKAQEKEAKEQARAQAKAAAQAAKEAEKEAKIKGKKAAVGEALGGDLGNLAAAAQSAGGPLGMVAGKVQQIAGVLGRVPPQAALLIALFVAATAAVTLTVAAVYKLGEAALSVVAQRNALLATFGALSGGGSGGAKTLAIVEKLGVALPFATERIAEWATGLQKAGFQGRALESAIKAIAGAEALVKGGGQAAEQLLKTLGMGGPAAMQLIATLKRGGPEARAQLADMGLRVEDVAAALGMTVQQFQRANLSAKQMAEAVEKALAKKAAGPLGDLMLTFPVLIQKAREGIMSLFDNVGPAARPFMEAVKTIFDNFTRGGKVIEFLRPIVTSLMVTLFSWGTRGAQTIAAIVSWLLRSVQAGGMFAGVIKVLQGAWTTAKVIFASVFTLLSPMLGLLKMVWGNANVLRGIGYIFTFIAAAIVIVLAVLGTLAAALITIGGYIVGFFASIIGGAAGLASAIMEGLLGGIDPTAFAAKMAELGNAGLAAFKGVFGIASPSKVMLEHGDKNISGAAATGVDRGADKFDRAMGGLSPDGAKGSGGARGGAGVIVIEKLEMPIYMGPRDDGETVVEKIESYFANLARGALPEPAT